MKWQLRSLAVAALVCSGSAYAVDYTYTGNTTGAPTFQRPLANLTGLSVAGNGVNYNAFTFSVSTSGSYTMTTTPVPALSWDTFMVLYSPTFLPASGLTNALAANDDFGGIGVQSQIIFPLTVGTSYTLVNTGFAAGADFGAFTTTLSGPGTVLPAGVVPEPGTYAMMAGGLLLIGASLRRRQVVKH